MNGPFMVALDQGTSGCRAVAVDKNGHIGASKSKIFSPLRKAIGLSEYNASELLEAQCLVLNELLDEIGPHQAAALAVCSQRSSVVLWDKQTGSALAPVLTWEDGRAQQEADQAPLTQAQVHLQTGLFKTPHFSAPKIAWCLAHFPAARAAAQAGTLAVGPVASYLIWHLTGGTTFATDATLAQRTLLWDIQQQNWSPNLCEAFGVPPTCLPALFPTVADYGAYVYRGATIPIYVCVADQQAAAVQEIQTGKTVVNYGTGAFVLHPVGGHPKVLPGMLSSIAATRPDRSATFLLEGPVFAAGSVLDWLKMKGLLLRTEQADAVAATATHPVQFLPSFGGLGAPYWNYTVAVPRWQNVTPHTTQADWVAGALQGIAHLVADIVDYLRANGQVITHVTVSGGLSRSAYLMQFQSDMLQVPLEVLPQAEGTVWGSAYLAAQRLGWQPSTQPLAVPTVFRPKLSAKQAQAQRRQWQVFVKKIFQE